MKNMKIVLDSKEIGYLVVEKATGRIIESGEAEGQNDTFEDSFIDLETVKVGQAPKISYNKGVYSRRKTPKEPVWAELLYKVLEVK